MAARTQQHQGGSDVDTHVASRRLRADDHGFRLHLRSSTFGMVDKIVNNCVNVCIADGSAVGPV